MMIKNGRSLTTTSLGFFILILLTGCHPDKKGDVKVQLNGYVGSQPLSFTNTIYNDGMGKQFYFSNLQFYISHFNLVKDDNALVEIQKAAYFEYGNSAWHSFSVKEVPAGNYKGIQFSVGLDTAQNNIDPVVYENDPANPLAPKPDMYWAWLKHRFIVLEGRADTMGGNFASGAGLQYHVGRDTTYRTVTINGPSFSIDKDGTATINLNLDLLKIFYGSTDTLDMLKQSGTQSENNDLDVAIKFANQFSKAFSYSK